MTPKEADQKYGKENIEKMKKTGWLDGITVSLNEKGEIDVPEEDYERAFKAVYNKPIYDWD